GTSGPASARRLRTACSCRTCPALAEPEFDGGDLAAYRKDLLVGRLGECVRGPPRPLRNLLDVQRVGLRPQPGQARVGRVNSGYRSDPRGDLAPHGGSSTHGMAPQPWAGEPWAMLPG